MGPIPNSQCPVTRLYQELDKPRCDDILAGTNANVSSTKLRSFGADCATVGRDLCFNRRRHNSKWARADRCPRRIPNAEVGSTGVEGRRRTTTTDKGSYPIDLAPGVYAAEIANSNFCPLRRGKFLATNTAEISIDFQLWICASDASDTYNFVELDSAKNTDLRRLVLYGRVRRDGDKQIFTGATLGRIYPVVFTFNLLTVEADELTYDRTEHVVIARGNVSWQDGKANDSASQLSAKTCNTRSGRIIAARARG
jgi:hypothetical protein